MTLFCHIIISKSFCYTTDTVTSECLMSDFFKIACFFNIVIQFSFLYVLFLCKPFSYHFIKEILLLKLRFYNTSNFHTATFFFNWIKYCHFLKILHFPKIGWPSHDNERPLVFMGSGLLFCGVFCEVFCGEAFSSQFLWFSDTFYVNDVSVVSSLVLPLTVLKEFVEGLCLTSEFFWLSKVSISMNYHLNSSEQLCFLQ